MVLLNPVFTVFFLLLHAFHSMGQDTPLPYFQQQVDYEIDVRLDDVKHQLHGFMRIHYTNHAPHSLERIAIHLYPNAYRSKQTRFAEQQLRLGKLEFYNAPISDMGYIDSLSFHVHGKKLAMRHDPDHADVMWVKLKEPLPPGSQVTIESSFRVQLPASFSRLGHVFQTYQVTQWYPKPAVYDQAGWHLVPYLDQGEFFYDFGDYTVRITLPQNYIVAATGELADQRELAYLYERVAASRVMKNTYAVVPDTIPPSSPVTKTIEFRAFDVPDFAWFADKRFRVDTSSVTLQNGHTVQTWAFYTKSESAYWQRATDYLNRSVAFFADEVGPFPWPQMTAVQAPLSKGVGMEYPMITLIGLAFSPKALDQVITHEVGHNWFYGMLATNERAYPWLDEGINTFYEQQYMRQHYGDEGTDFIPSFLSRKSDMSDVQALYFDLARQRKLIPGKADPFAQDALSYYLNAYEIPALGLKLIQEMMGTADFRNAMRAYFHAWKMKHPGPETFQAFLEGACDCSLDWYTKELLADGGIVDYAITDVEAGRLILENRGTVRAPVEIIFGNGDGEIRSEWIQGFSGQKEIPVSGNDWKTIQLYNTEYTLDVDWSDNTFRSSRFLPKAQPVRFRFGSGMASSEHHKLYVLPLAGINTTDRGMLGVGLTNQKLPNPAFRWILAPMYGLHSQDIVGFGEIRKDIYLSGGLFDRLTIRGSAKRFSYYDDPEYGFVDRYTKLEAGLRLRFRKPDRYTRVGQHVSFRVAHIHQKYGIGLDIGDLTFTTDQRNYYINEFRYLRKDENVLAPSKLAITGHQGKGFLKFMVNYRQKITYRKKSRGLWFHLFGGVLAQNNQPDANVDFLFNGQTSTGFAAKDYLYDEILLGRNAQTGIFSQQVFLRDAELKTLSTVGISDRWMVGGGFSTSLPIPLPIHFYADFALYRDPFVRGMNFSYSSGFAIVAAKDFLEIYFPVFESKDIRESITYAMRDRYVERISFLINLKALHPFDMGDHFFEFLYR